MGLESQLQFNASNISDKLREARGFSAQSRELFSEMEQHSIRSPTYVVVNRVENLTPHFDNKGPFQSDAVTNPAQHDYLRAVYKGAIELGQQTRRIFEAVDPGTCSIRGLNKMAKEYHSAIQEFLALFPSLDNLLELGPLNPIQQILATDMDSAAGLIAFASNRIFKEGFIGNRYLLKEGIKTMALNIYDSLARAGIGLEMCKIWPIQTAVDYSGIVSQLVENAAQHAFNGSRGLRPQISISGSPEILEMLEFESVPANTGTYSLRVSDNGSGIDPGIRQDLFEKHASSKPKDGGEHGVGLWSARQYAQEHGASLELERTGPDGTAFSLVIPYSSVRSKMCVQESSGMAAVHIRQGVAAR